MVSSLLRSNQKLSFLKKRVLFHRPCLNGLLSTTHPKRITVSKEGSMFFLYQETQMFGTNPSAQISKSSAHYEWTYQGQSRSQSCKPSHWDLMGGWPWIPTWNNLMSWWEFLGYVQTTPGQLWMSCEDILETSANAWAWSCWHLVVETWDNFFRSSDFCLIGCCGCTPAWICSIGVSSRLKNCARDQAPI